MSYLVSLLFLLVFWFLLVGQVNLETLVVGAVIITTAKIYDRGLGRNYSWFIPRSFLVFLWNGFLYFVTMVIEVFKANLQMAYIVLHPRCPISPQLVNKKTRLQTDGGKVLLANSITLTPGTLTVLLKDDEVLVHAINDEAARGLTGWPVDKRLERLEES